MTSRERVLAALDRRPVDRIPTDYWGTPEITQSLLRHFGVDNTLDLWPKLHIDKILNPATTHAGPPRVDTPELRIDYWGVHRAPQAFNGGVYWEKCHYPIQRFYTIDEIEANYTWPSADWFDFSSVAEEYGKHREYALMTGYMAPFFMFNNIRGLETSLLDLVANPELSDYCIGKICDFLYEYHGRLFEAARGLIDITEVTDDFGCQHGLLLSHETFRRYFAPHYRRFIRLANDFGIRVFHHDDGAMGDLIPDLLELGIQILNPLQWRLPGMDPARLKSEFGHRLSFHGGIDNQHVMPFGSLREVEEEVRFCLATLGQGGTGYVLAPCHNLQAITPVENVVCMYETAYHEGRV